MQLGEVVWRCFAALPKIVAKIQVHLSVHPDVSFPHGVRKFARHLTRAVAKAPVLAGTTCRYVVVGTAIVVASGPPSSIPSNMVSPAASSVEPFNTHPWNYEPGQVSGDPAMTLDGQAGNVGGERFHRQDVENVPPISVVSEPESLLLWGFGIAGLFVMRRLTRLRQVAAEPLAPRRPK
jgi:hypothetical protein